MTTARQCTRTLWPVGLLAFSASCAMTTADYVDTHEAHSLLQCSLVKVENLTTDRWVYLRDGMAVVTNRAGCRAHVDLGGATSVLELDAGCVLVFGTKGDCILMPVHSAEAPAAARTGGSRSAPVTTARPPAVEEPAGCGPTPADTGLPAHVVAVLHLLEARSICRARDQIDQLATRFPNDPLVSSYQEILRTHLAAIQNEASHADPLPLVATDAAHKALTEGKALLARGDMVGARKAFERAYALNPANPDVTGALCGVLKKTGLKLYSQGAVADAIALWQRSLEVSPTDAEAKQYLKRAEAVSKELEPADGADASAVDRERSK